MIVYDPQVKYEKHRPSIIANVNNKKNTQTSKKDLTPAIENPTVCVNATEESDFMKILNSTSPYWFFAFGFLLGSACGTFTCYIWLTKRITCCRRYRERRSNDIQRVSLLQDLWQFDDPAFNDSRQRTVSCPGTPPPPYREVMLRPGLYRSPSVITNTTNNAATNGTARTQVIYCFYIFLKLRLIRFLKFGTLTDTRARGVIQNTPRLLRKRKR